MSNPLTTLPRLLITAGPTHEPIDAVRYIANRSSGKLGIALAEAAAPRNWQTTLLLGPLPESASPRIDVLMNSTYLSLKRFRTTCELQQQLLKFLPQHDILIMAAAVADYRPAQMANSDQKTLRKIPRGAEKLVLEFEPTPDLLAEAARISRPDQTLIGFSLTESATLMETAEQKLKKKGIHAIVANPLETMDAETISAKVLLADGRVLEPPAELSKTDFANWLLDQIAVIREQRQQQ